MAFNIVERTKRADIHRGYFLLARFGRDDAEYLRVGFYGKNRRPRLDNAGLLPGDVLFGRANQFRVVKTDSGNDGDILMRDDIGRIVTSAAADFDNGPVYVFFGKVRQGNGRS